MLLNLHRTPCLPMSSVFRLCSYPEIRESAAMHLHNIRELLPCRQKKGSDSDLGFCILRMWMNKSNSGLPKFCPIRFRKQKLWQTATRWSSVLKIIRGQERLHGIRVQSRLTRSLYLLPKKHRLRWQLPECIWQRKQNRKFKRCKSKDRRTYVLPVFSVELFNIYELKKAFELWLVFIHFF